MVSVAETCGGNRMIRSKYIVASAANITIGACSRNAARELSMGRTLRLPRGRGGASVTRSGSTPTPSAAESIFEDLLDIGEAAAFRTRETRVYRRQEQPGIA